ncbi:MAG: relaxase/mobilization nuclease domain-containing protein [Bacteroidetes bacterium]|nr:relaxase/mobilization nuclease domain-containing protein [Bacteroidota bacterium]
MVAKFETGSSLRQTLNYNEQKVRKGTAEFLGAVNYLLSDPALTFERKLAGLENLAQLNERVTRNSIHISLNFDPSEQLTNEQLKSIAEAYMEQIRLGEQPYLVYRHRDAGHPHIHVVSVKVRPDGRRVDTQNIGRNESEVARKNIERQFGLVRAEDQKAKESYQLQPVQVARIIYGKTETKKAIGHVLRHIVDGYRYTSLPELNAVLRLYNVVADRGNEGSHMFRNNGLVYRVLDEQGNKVGVPIKASSFYNRPTLDYLQQKFTANEPLKNPFKAGVKNVIDLAFLRQTKPSINGLIASLNKAGITAILRQNEQGYLYGITYVDHRNKCVFNGSDLGKSYSAKGITERCGIAQKPTSDNVQTVRSHAHESDHQSPTFTGLADDLLHQEFTGDTLPYDLKRRRKKRKRLNND